MKKTYILFLAVIMIFGYSVSVLAGTSFEPLYNTTYNTTDGHTYNTTDGNHPYYVPDGEPVHDHAAPYYLFDHGDTNTPTDAWTFDDRVLYSIVKFDDPPDTQPEFNSGESNPFSVDPVYFQDDSSGTWQYTGAPITYTDKDDNEQTINDPATDNITLYFSIKTANGTSEPPGGYNLFVMNDNYDWETDTLVHWSTLNDFFDTEDDNLGNHNLSHITFWASVTSSDTPPGPVPEPATVFMFGMGLLVFGSICRRKMSNSQKGAAKRFF